MSGASARFCARPIPKLFVTLSHEIVREYREYERTSTTALNAFIGPRVQTYLGRLENHLRDEKFGGKLNIMRSNGGVMSVRLAQEQPVSMMESGPVAGIIGAGRLAALMGIERAIGFDMGGTTAKASLITNGVPAIEDGYVIGGEASGQPMQIPVVDIVEIGAGGGSIAWCDPTGGIHVGPKSAGADPGPAAYGKGSTDPVVTDANLVLGRINAERFLNGAMKLDVKASERAIEQKLCGPTAARREGSSARHRADRRRRHVARGARGVGQEGRRSARDRDDRVRRRRAAACRRHRARDFHSQGHHPEGAGHVLGARHADGVVAAGFRPHALWAAGLARRQAGRGGVRRTGRGRPGPGRPRRHRVRAPPTSPISPTCAMSARSTPSPSRCAIRNC